MTAVGIQGRDALTHGVAPADVQHYNRAGTLQLSAPPPLALYVHFPWCVRKCPYCDFNSHAAPAEGLPEIDYVDALVADLDLSLPLIWGRPVQSVFLGGGTPSLVTPQSLDRLLGAVRARLPLAGDCEITIEANPGTFERDRFRAFRSAGVTRLSLGVQSFSDTKLQALGRVHDGAQARAAVEEAQVAFDTFNLDLMYGLPGQTLDELEQDVSTALSFRPPHLSVYHLTIEPNTYFAKFPPVLPDDDICAQMLDLITGMTLSHGLQRYEVSAYSAPGHRSRHNQNYWQFGDYLGIGAGAHSKLSFAHRVIRQVRLRDPHHYLRGALSKTPIATDQDVPRKDLPFEFMLNGLRLAAGIDLDLFTQRTGLPLSAIERSLAGAVEKGLLERDGKRVWPSVRGFDFLNDLQELFLPDPP